MRGAELLERMELTELRYVQEAEAAPAGRPRRVVRWAAAACVCAAVLAAALLLPRPDAEQGSAPMEGAPFVTVDGQDFIISPHLTAVSVQCPAGFSEAGVLESGEMAGCAYALDPARPEWVYVRQQTTLDGTIDSSGTANTTEPHMAWVRYVDARLRGRQLICRDGVLYISLWSADALQGEAEESDAARRFGVRIEAETVEGFVSLGRADFSGDDTVPSGALCSNEPELEVWADPARPELLLASATWYTAGDSAGERRHTGFDVYARWCSPYAAQYTGAD